MPESACIPLQRQETPFYRLVERFYPEFERVYEERYGFWRPAWPPKRWRRRVAEEVCADDNDRAARGLKRGWIFGIEQARLEQFFQPAEHPTGRDEVGVVDAFAIHSILLDEIPNSRAVCVVSDNTSSALRNSSTFATMPSYGARLGSGKQRKLATINSRRICGVTDNQTPSFRVCTKTA